MGHLPFVTFKDFGNFQDMDDMQQQVGGHYYRYIYSLDNVNLHHLPVH